MAIAVPSTNPIYPSSTDGLIFKSKLGNQYIIPATKYLQYGATAALASSTTETSLFNNTSTTAYGTLVFGGGELTNGWNIANVVGAGAMLRVRMGGIIANTSTPDLTIKLTMTNSAGTVTTLSSTTNLATVAITGTANWNLDATIIVSAYSATVGQFLTHGQFNYTQTTLLTTGWKLPYTATAANLDTTSMFTLGATATWGTSSSSNTLTAQWATVEVLA